MNCLIDILVTYFVEELFCYTILETDFTCHDIHIYIYTEYISIIFVLPYLVQGF